MSDDFVRFTAMMTGGSDVARLLNRYPGKVGRTLESLVKQEARGLAVELARNTRPFGFSQKAKKRGESAVAEDIKTVFALPSDAFEKFSSDKPAVAAKFWANIQNRRFSQAQKTLQSSGSQWSDVKVGRLDPKVHQQNRNVRGQVKRLTKPAAIVTSPKALNTYIAKIQKRVGFAKGSWINAAKAIGGRVRGAAQWATRHKQSPGTATIKTGDKPAVTLINKLDYIEQVKTSTGIELALQVAAGKLRKALAISLRKINGQTSARMKRAG